MEFSVPHVDPIFHIYMTVVGKYIIICFLVININKQMLNVDKYFRSQELFKRKLYKIFFMENGENVIKHVLSSAFYWNLKEHYK